MGWLLEQPWLSQSPSCFCNCEECVLMRARPDDHPLARGCHSSISAHLLHSPHAWRDGSRGCRRKVNTEQLSLVQWISWDPQQAKENVSSFPRAVLEVAHEPISPLLWLVAVELSFPPLLCEMRYLCGIKHVQLRGCCLLEVGSGLLPLLTGKLFLTLSCNLIFLSYLVVGGAWGYVTVLIQLLFG